MIDKECLKQIRENGFVCLPSFYSKQADKVLKETKQILNKAKDDSKYEFGKAVRIGSVYSNVDKNPEIFSLFSDEFMLSLVDKYVGDRDNFNKDIFITHDYRSDAGLARNGYLHFDRLWRFKFFIYLTDVDENCGPLTVCPGTHIRGEELRKNSWACSSDYGEVKNRIELDFPNEEFEEIKLIGPKGTLIIFDTDTFHKGGEVSEDNERIVIRGHSW